MIPGGSGFRLVECKIKKWNTPVLRVVLQHYEGYPASKMRPTKCRSQSIPRPLSLVWAHIEICHPRISEKWEAPGKSLEDDVLHRNMLNEFPTVETCPVLLLSAFRSPAAIPKATDPSEDSAVGPQCKTADVRPGTSWIFFSGISMVFSVCSKRMQKVKTCHHLCCSTSREGMCLLVVLSYCSCNLQLFSRKLWAMRRICKNAWQAWDNSYLK